MAQDAAAHDRQVGVGAAGVMRELADEIKYLGQGLLVHLHGLMLLVQHDAMLVEIGVGTVLQVELLPCQLNGHDAVGLAGREVDAPGIADILLAEHAGGVAALGLQALQGDGLGVLLGLGQIDGDLQLAVGGGSVPLDVLGDLGSADIVRYHAEIIEPVGSSLGALFHVQLMELFANFALAGHQSPHQAGLEVDAVLGHSTVKQFLAGSQFHHFVQQGGGGRRVLLRRFGLAGGGQLQQIQQRVAGHQLVQFFDQLMLTPEAQQALHVQCKARVALLRRQGGAVKIVLCHDTSPPVAVCFVFRCIYHTAFSSRFPWRCVPRFCSF